jgi:hypothetical protein
VHPEEIIFQVFYFAHLQKSFPFALPFSMYFLSCHSYMWGQGWGRAGTGDSFLTYRSASERFTEIVARSVSWLGLTPCNAAATVPLQQIKKKPQNGVSKGEFGGEIGKAGNYTSKIHFDP